MDEDNCAARQKLAADADQEAAKHQPDAAALGTIRQALGEARTRLGGEDVGKHYIPFSPTTWQPVGVSLPHPVVTTEAIGRQDGFDVAKLPQTVATNWALFCTSFVFGYGTVAYGPSRFRVITALTPQSDLCTVIAEARRRLAQCGPLSAYDYLRGRGPTRTVPYWGPAFFTKLLYFADPSRRALILDNRLAWIVHELSGIENLVDKRGRSKRWTRWRYAVYLAWMYQVADQLEVQPDLLEYGLFREARRRRRRPSRRSGRHRSSVKDRG